MRNDDIVRRARSDGRAYRDGDENGSEDGVKSASSRERSDASTSVTRRTAWFASLVGRETARGRLERRAAYERRRAEAIRANGARVEATESVRAVAMDVERLPSDDPTARSVTMVEALKRILVTHAIGTRRGYRQGMHEVASAVLLCCASAAEYSAAPKGTGRWEDGDSESMAFVDVDHGEDEDAEAAGERDYRFVEHDAFAAFVALMGDASDRESDGRLILAAYYEDASTPTSPISEAFRRINNALRSVDAALAKKLRDLEVEPQLYLLRWLRLAYGREFHRSDVLELWDAIFECLPGVTSDGETISSRDVYEGMAVSVLISMRNELLSAEDFGTAMSQLQQVPQGIHMRHMIARSKAIAMTGQLKENGPENILTWTKSSRKHARQSTTVKNRLVVPGIAGKSMSTSQSNDVDSLDVEASANEESSSVSFDLEASYESQARREEKISKPYRRVESLTLSVPAPVSMTRTRRPSRRDVEGLELDSDPFTAPIFGAVSRQDPDRTTNTDVAASREAAMRHLRAALDALSRASSSGDVDAGVAALQIDTALGRLSD